MWGFEVPEWRPGVVYFMPTSDGREIGVYAELFGEARLYRGPLASDGYEESWRYGTVVEAVQAARAWDGESEAPPGREPVMSGEAVHGE